MNTIDPQWWASLSKKEKEEVTTCAKHVQRLIEYIDTDDRTILEEELGKNKEKMLSQIRKKLPDLKLDSVELIRGSEEALIRREPFKLQ